MTGRVGSMVAPQAVPPAGAFLSGQAVFHGRELLAELPLVSDLPFFPGLALGGAGCTGPATPFGLDPRPCPEARRRLPGGGGGRRRDVLFLRRLPSPRPVGRVSEG